MTPEQFEQAVALKRAGVGTVSGVGGMGAAAAPRMGLNVNTTPGELGPLKLKQNGGGATAAASTAPTSFANLDGLSAATGGVRAAGDIGGPRPPWLNVMYGGAPGVPPKAAAAQVGPLAEGDQGGPLLTPDKKAPDKTPEPPKTMAPLKPPVPPATPVSPKPPTTPAPPVPGAAAPGNRLHDPYGNWPGYTPPAAQPDPSGARMFQGSRPVTPDTPGVPTASTFTIPPPDGASAAATDRAKADPANAKFYPQGPVSLTKPPPAADPTVAVRPDGKVGPGADRTGEESAYYTKSDGTRVYRPGYVAKPTDDLSLVGSEAGALARDATAGVGNAAKFLYGGVTGNPVQYDTGAAPYRQAVQKWEQERDQYYKSVGQPTVEEAVALRNSGAGFNRTTGAVTNDTRNGLRMPANQEGQHFVDAAALYGTAKIPGLGGAKSAPGVAAKGVDAAADAAAAVKTAPKPAPVVPAGVPSSSVTLPYKPPAAPPVAAPKPTAPVPAPAVAAPSPNQSLTRAAYDKLSPLAREEYDHAVRLGMKPPPTAAPTAPRLYPEPPVKLTPAGPQPELVPLAPPNQAEWAAGGMKGPVPRPLPPGSAPAPVPAPSVPTAPPRSPVQSSPESLLDYLQNKNRPAPTARQPAPAGMVRRVNQQNLPSTLEPVAPSTAPAPSLYRPVGPTQAPKPIPPAKGPAPVAPPAPTPAPTAAGTAGAAPALSTPQEIALSNMARGAAEGIPLHSDTLAQAKRLGLADASGNLLPHAQDRFKQLVSAAKASPIDDAAAAAAKAKPPATPSLYPPAGAADDVVPLTKAPPAGATGTGPRWPTAQTRAPAPVTAADRAAAAGVTAADETAAAGSQVKAVADAAAKAKSKVVNPFSARQLAGTAVDPTMWPGLAAKWLGTRQSLPGWLQKGLDWTGRRVLDPIGTAAGTLTGTADLRQMIHATDPLKGTWSPGRAALATGRNSAIRTGVQTASGRPDNEITANPLYDTALGRAKALYDNSAGPAGNTLAGFGNLWNEMGAKPLAEPLAPVDRVAAKALMAEKPIETAYTGIGDETARAGVNVGSAAQRLGKQVELQAKDVKETGTSKQLGQYANEVKRNNSDLQKVLKAPADPSKQVVPSFADVAAHRMFGSPLPGQEQPAKPAVTAPPAATAEQDAQQFGRQFEQAVAAGDPAAVDAMVADYVKKTPPERQAVTPITRLDARQFNMPEPQLNALVDGPQVQGSTPLSQRVAASRAEFQQLQGLPPEQRGEGHDVKVHAAQQRMAAAERDYQGRLAQVYEEKVLPGRVQQVDRNAPLLKALREKTDRGESLTPQEQQQLPALAEETRQAMGDVYKHALRKANLDFAVKSEPTAANKNMAIAGEVLKKIGEVKPVLGADGQPLMAPRVGPDGISRLEPVTEPANPIGQAVWDRINQDLLKAGVDNPQEKANDLFSQLEGFPKMLLLGGLGLGAVGLLASAFGIGGAAMPILAALGGGAALFGMAGGSASNLMSGSFWSGLPNMLGQLPGAIGSALGLTSKPDAQPGQQSQSEINLQKVFSGPTGSAPFEKFQRGLTPDVVQKMSPQQIAQMTAAVRPDQRELLKAHLAGIRPDLGLVVDQVNDYERQARDMASKPKAEQKPLPATVATGPAGGLTETLKRFGVGIDSRTNLPDADKLMKLDDAKKTDLIKSIASSPQQKDMATKMILQQVATESHGRVKDKQSLADAVARASSGQVGVFDVVGHTLVETPKKLQEAQRTGKPTAMQKAKQTLELLDRLEKGARLYPLKVAFAPDLTPDQMAAEGVYGRLTGGTGPRLAGKDTAFPEWYKKYHAGVRTPDDDKQMTRQRNFLSWHGPQFAKNPTPRRAYTLLNWGVDPNKLVAPEVKNDLRKRMMDYRKKQDSTWLAGKA